MTQLQQIDEFMEILKYSINIKGNTISSDDIYDVLKNYGVNDEFRNKMIAAEVYSQILKLLDYKNGNFNCSYIKQSPSMGEYWQYFSTVPRKLGNSNDFKIKMYISIKPEQIAKAIETLIKFLIDNEIVTQSKISNSYSSDTVIINVLNANDANKILKFISNSNITNLLAPHHPFIPDYEGVGIIIGYDNNGSSYTGRLSAYLARYINECKKRNKSELINFKSFLASLIEYRINNHEVKQIVDTLNIIMAKLDNAIMIISDEELKANV